MVVTITKKLILKISKDPHSVVFTGNPRTKVTLKKFFEPEYKQALLELEAQNTLLRLCSAHWKADQMIGQALLHQSDAETKAPNVPHPAPSSFPDTGGLPSEPYAAFIPQDSDVTSTKNTAKQTHELSPGPKSPSVVRAQKRIKDNSIVPGKKIMGPAIGSDSECPT